jgi:DNA repair protein RadC
MVQYKSTFPEFTLGKKPSEFLKVKIQSSKDCEQVIRKFYSDDIDIYESFFLLLLNRANITIGYVKISQGGITGTVVDVKLVLKYVVDSLACGVVCCHNHPSGNLNPSEEDKRITAKIKEALKYLDSHVLDHLILTSESYYSFADNGIL